MLTNTDTFRELLQNSTLKYDFLKSLYQTILPFLGSKANISNDNIISDLGFQAGIIALSAFYFVFFKHFISLQYKTKNKKFVQSNTNFSRLEDRSELHSKPILTRHLNFMPRPVKNNTSGQSHKKKKQRKIR